MNLKLKNFTKDSLYYGIGDGLGRLTSILLLPILSRIFMPSDYGIIDLLTASYAFFFVVINLNVLSGFQKFFYQVSGKQKRILVTTVIATLLFFVLLVSVLLVIFSEKLSLIFFGKRDYACAIAILSSCLPFEMLYNSLLMLLRLQRKAILFSVMNITRIIFVTMATYICVVILTTGISGVFIAKIISLSTISIGLLIIQRHEFTTKFNFKAFKNVFFFSLPGHPSLIIKSIMDVLPRYILSYYSTLTAVGLFGVAFRISKTLDMYINAFNRAWNPFAFLNAGKPDEKYLYEKIFKLYSASLIFFGIILTLFAKEALIILTPAKYHSAFILVGGICFYLAVRGVILIFSTAFYTINMVKHTSYLNLIHIMTFIPCAMLLVPRYNVYGLIIAMDIGIIIYFLCYMIMTIINFKFFIPFKKLALFLVVGALGVACLNHLIIPFWEDLLLKILFTFIYLILLYLLLLDKNEKNIIQKKIYFILKKLPAN